MIEVFLVGLALLQAAPSEKPVVATPLSPKTPPASWVTNDDYPPVAKNSRQMGIVGFRLDVDDKGKVSDCHLTRSSGFALLDVQTCRVLTYRASFKPARDAFGKAVPATFSSNFRWELPGVGEEKLKRLASLVGTPFDITVNLARLPADYRAPAVVHLLFGHGEANACSVDTSSGSAKLDAIACEQARLLVKPPAKPKSGETRLDSRIVNVAFELGDEPSR
jgi:TonB family protein